jgi:hypothetical protein
LNPVNFNLSPGFYAIPLNPFPISLVGVRNMQRAVESALILFGINDIVSFGSLVIAMSSLRSNRVPSQRDPVRSEHLRALQ